MAIKYDNCKDCHSRCVQAGKDRKFVCINGVSCKITKANPQSNADRIRAMSDFELAKEIENAQSGIEIKNPKNIDYFDCILDWLRHPAEESGKETVEDQKDGDWND